MQAVTKGARKMLLRVRGKSVSLHEDKARVHRINRHRVRQSLHEDMHHELPQMKTLTPWDVD